MDLSRILIRTRQTKVLFEDVEAHINGVSLNVKIIEDTQGPLRIHTPEDVELEHFLTDDSDEYYKD